MSLRTGWRRLAVAVDQLVEQLLRLLGGAQRRDAAVDIHALLARGNVALRKVRRNREVGGAFGALRGFFAALLKHGFFQKLQVHIVADAHHVARLLGAEQIARAANFKVAHRDAEARAELRVLADGGEALGGDLGENFPAR